LIWGFHRTAQRLSSKSRYRIWFRMNKLNLIQKFGRFDLIWLKLNLIFKY
jgi:hypothetical protein